MIKEAISQLISGKPLTKEEAAAVMEEIMQGEVTPAQFGALVTALRLKGETAEEIAGFAQVMRDKAVRVTVSEPVIDIVGTGGDNFNTFNISTATAFVAAGAGLKVAKHGNRAMSSKCGSADVLEALGVKIDLGAKQVQKCINEVGIGFMFAPVFHPAMKYAAAPRREIGIRTIFNILGPLTNPAGATAQLMGVAEESLVEKMTQVLQKLGCQHALVVHSEDGLDEIAISGKTLICELKDNTINKYFITPEELGFSRATLDSIKGGTSSENADILRSIFAGTQGPQRDTVLINSAAGLLAGDKVETLKEGVELAREIIDTGKALDKVNKLCQLSQNLG